ncbi:MAG: hypothetical protein RJA34_180, partial [Pseudomonadota bacterium]
MRLASVSVLPWTLEFRLRGLTVDRAASKPGDTPQFRLDELYVDLELQSLLRLAPVVDALEITAPQLEITHLGNGRYDVDDLLTELLKPSPGPTPQFAAYNIRLSAGRIVVHDESTASRHELDELTLTLPFLSNLDAQREVSTHPKLSFRLNGSAFETVADTTPFADNKRTRAELHIAGMDLQPYLSYWPEVLPVRMTSGVVDASVAIAFEQQTQPSLVLSGKLGLSELAVSEHVRKGATDQPLLTVQRIALSMGDVRPMERRFELKELAIISPHLHARRDQAGTLNLARLAEKMLPANQVPASQAAPATIKLDAFNLEGGQL